MASVQPRSKISFVREMMSSKPELTYEELVSEWGKAGYDSESPPHSTAYYRVRGEMKPKSKTFNRSSRKFDQNDYNFNPIEEIVNEKTLNGSSRSSKGISSSKIDSYEEIESGLDDVLALCREVEDEDLCEAVRKARRLVSRLLV